MEHQETFVVIGGDSRTEYLARYLQHEHNVMRTPVLPIPAGAHLLFPMPFSRDRIHVTGLEEGMDFQALLAGLLGTEPKTLFGGQIPHHHKE